MIAALLALPLQAPLERFEYRRPLFGVEARIVLHAADQKAADLVARGLWARAEKLDRALSDWREDGVLADAARAAGSGAAVEVPADTYDVLRVALDVAEASDGAFDPTIAPLSHLWRAARAKGAVPDAAAIEAARALVDWRALELASGERGAGTVRLPRAGMALDLGGIAKGFAAGALLDTAARRGAHSAMIELGGDVALGAPPPGADGWRIEIDGRVLELANCAVATSGADFQHVEVEGRRWSHVVDPRTGLALDHRRGATVIARSAALADALASAATVLSPPEAEALVERYSGALVHLHADRRALFDGTSLAGWRETGGPYDGAARWSVEDGAIVGRPGAQGEGGLLYTDEMFSAFELDCEVALDHPFDSGVFVHMLPKEQGLRGLQVTLDHREGGEIAAVYADGFLLHNEAAARHFVRGAWNHVRVRVTGFDPRVEAWVEGAKVLDYSLPEGSAGFARHGRIALQVHEVRLEGEGDAARERSARFRRVRVRELPVFGEGLAGGAPSLDAAVGVAAPCASARDAGWRDLLADGLAAFDVHGDAQGYALDGGVLAIPAHGTGHLATREELADFAATLEFELATGANSGLFLRAARDGDPAHRGFEVQLIDDAGWERASGDALAPWQRAGSLYGVLAAPDWKRPVTAGEWHRLEVLARGRRLACALDGLVLWDVEIDALEADPSPAERPRAGFLGLQRYGQGTRIAGPAIEVRNLWLRKE